MPASSAERDRWLRAVRTRVENAAGHGEAVLDVAAISDVDALLASAATVEDDLEVLALAGRFYWARAELKSASRRSDLEIALTLLHPCFAADPASIPADSREQVAARRADDFALWGYLGGVIFRHVQRARDADALEQAIRLLRRATAEERPRQVSRTEALANLGAALRLRYRLNRSEADLGQAIDAQRRAVRAAGQRHPRSAQMSDALVQMLTERFALTEDVQLLDEATDQLRQTLRTAGAGDPARCRRLYDLAAQYGQRYRLSRRQADYDTSLSLVGEALKLSVATGDGDVRLLALALVQALHGARYERLGRPEDLEQSIAASGEALQLVPGRSPRRAVVASDLGLGLRLRYERFGDTFDLNESVNLAREAADLAREAAQLHPGSVRLPEFLANLANALCVRFKLGRDPADAEDAVRVSRESVASLGRPDHPSRPGCLNNLGRALGCRYDARGDVSDLADEVAAFREAVDLADASRPERGGWLTNLGNALGVQGALAHDSAVLNEAVVVQREAVQATAGDDPARAQRLYNLAAALRSQWQLTGSAPAATEASGRFMEAAGVTLAASSTRIEAAAAAGRLAAERGNFSQAADGFGLAVTLLPQLASRRLSRGDAQRWLAEFRGLASEAASCAVLVGDVARALSLFETGRGVLLSQALDLGGELAELEEADPGAAQRLDQLRAELDGVTSDPRENPVGLAERRRRAAAELDELVTQVRMRPGLERFMLPPSTGELIEAASDGAVAVINASPWGCQAMALQTGELTLIPLPDLDAAEAGQRADALLQAVAALQAPDSVRSERDRADGTVLQTLGWLWDVVCHPVLRALGHHQLPRAEQPWPRVWWVTSGPMSVFPLSCAGRYDAGLGSAVPDLVVSSSVPTVRALLRIRSARHSPVAAPRLLVVAMPHTEGADDLPGTEDEAEMLARRFAGSVVLVDEDATLARVRDELATATWAHFACHGISNPQTPEQSALLLDDHVAHPMTVMELSRMHLRGAAFAYLSACSASAGIPQLADEFVHITGGCLLAGFGSVIGTLWNIDDDISLEIADVVYADVKDRGLGRVPRTLQEALASIRAAHPDRPSLWAAHVHVGA